MTTTTYGILTGAVALLRAGSTDAGSRIYTPGDWPTGDKTVPYIRARVLSEHKQSLGRSGHPQFTVTGIIRFELMVDGKAQSNDAGAEAVDVALQRLERQVEVILINNGALWALGLQQFPQVDINDAYDASGAQHIGALNLDLGVEFYQGADGLGNEDFCPVPESALEAVHVYMDLVNVYDPNGTYPDPPFPAAVLPAPRTEGPDGRSEAEFEIELPQP